MCMLSHSGISDSGAQWALQLPLFMQCPIQEYWSGLPFPTPGDLPDPGIKSASPVIPALTDSLPLAPPGKPSLSLFLSALSSPFGFRHGHITCAGQRNVSGNDTYPFCMGVSNDQYVLCHILSVIFSQLTAAL